MADFAAHSLVLPQAAEQADLGGEHRVVGNLVNQLLSCTQVMTCSHLRLRIFRDKLSSFLFFLAEPSLKLQ